MPTSDANGLPIFNEGDDVVLHTMLNTVSSGVSNWINNGVPTYKVSSIAARNALVASVGAVNITATNPLVVWRADAAAGSQWEYNTTGGGGTWHTVLTSQWFATTEATITIPLAAGYTGSASAERIGRVVYLRWSCSSTFAANAAALPLFTVPAGWTPPSDTAASMGGTSLYPWTGRVTSAGAVQVRNNHSGAQSAMVGSAVYLL